MTAPNAETLEKWKQAGVLFECSEDGKSWGAPTVYFGHRTGKGEEWKLMTKSK